MGIKQSELLGRIKKVCYDDNLTYIDQIIRIKELMNDYEEKHNKIFV